MIARALRNAASVSFVIALTYPAPLVAPAAAEVFPRVELRCAIVPRSIDKEHKTWTVVLRRSSGEPLRQKVIIGGSTARFDDLEPGLYVLCISGERDRRRCHSMDLIPPPGVTRYRFEKEINTPPLVLNEVGTRTISASRLAGPNSARREMKRAEKAQLRGNTKEAFHHLERAIELYPNYVDALNNLGTYYHRKGDYRQSSAHFQRAIELDPSFFPGWVNLGGSLLALSEFESALEANKRAVELRPDNVVVNSKLGLCYYYLRKYEDAKPYFHKVIELDPEYASSPHLFLAHIAFAEGSYGEANDFIRSYLKLHPNSPRAPELIRTLNSITSRDAKPAPNTLQPGRAHYCER